MNDFLDIQCDEAPYIPTESDWAEYQRWLDSQWVGKEKFLEQEQEYSFVFVGENFRPENCEDCPF